MSYTVEGVVQNIGEEQHFTSGFCMRPILITTIDEYPQPMQVFFFNDKGKLLDAITPKQKVRIKFDINVREHNGKYYNDLKGYAIQVLE